MVIQKTSVWAALLLIFLTTISVAMAAPEPLCLPREEAVKQLERQYQELAVGRGLISDGSLMFELFVSKLGTWTITTTDVHGKNCIVAYGEAWSNVPILVGQAS